MIWLRVIGEALGALLLLAIVWVWCLVIVPTMMGQMDVQAAELDVWDIMLLQQTQPPQNINIRIIEPWKPLDLTSYGWGIDNSPHPSSIPHLCYEGLLGGDVCKGHPVHEKYPVILPDPPPIRE